MRTRLTHALALILVSVMAVGLISSPAEAAKKVKIATGHYVGTETPEQPNGFDDIVYNFDVRKKKGRYTVRNFTIAMNVVCAGYPVYTEYVVQPMNTMRVSSKTGKFRDTVRGTTDGGTAYEVKVSGRLKGKRVTNGRMTYDVGICQRGTSDVGAERWKARKGR